MSMDEMMPRPRRTGAAEAAGTPLFACNGACPECEPACPSMRDRPRCDAQHPETAERCWLGAGHDGAHKVLSPAMDWHARGAA